MIIEASQERYLTGIKWHWQCLKLENSSVLDRHRNNKQYLRQGVSPSRCQQHLTGRLYHFSAIPAEKEKKQKHKIKKQLMAVSEKQQPSGGKLLHNMEARDVIEELEVSPEKGLSDEDVRSRQQKYGRNKLLLIK